MKMNPYAYLIDFKNYLYDHKILNKVSVATPVISVGNLSFGGSGKTPFIFFLCDKYSDKRILVISKSYKAALRNPAAVPEAKDYSELVKIYGDEACLIKQNFPNIDVWSGPDKSETVIRATAQQKYDLIIVDDGFTHRKLKRQLDIVLVDCSQSKKKNKLFPFGYLREDWKTLKRAQLVVLTKVDHVSKEQLSYYQEMVSGQGVDFILCNYQSELQINMLDRDGASHHSNRKNIFLFTGVGNPTSVKENLLKLGFYIQKEKFYSDHYSFPLSEQKNILNELNLIPDLVPVTTAKDRIKISLPELIEKLKVINLKITFQNNGEDILDAKISQLF